MAGGLARKAAYIDSLRREGRGVLILDSGNLFFEDPSAGTKSEDELALRADLILNAHSHMGYHAVNIGDFDLALGTKFLLRRRPSAKFPFLSSNLTDLELGRPLFEPYAVKEVDGLRVGVFGLVSPELGQGKPFSVEEPFEAARAMVKRLKRRCNLIIALSLLHGNEEALRLAAEVPGIDVVISGYGTPLPEPLVRDSTLILATNPRGESVGRLDLKIVRGSHQFYDASERERVRKSLEVIQGRLESLRGKGKDQPSTLEEMERLTERQRELEEALRAFMEASCYTHSLIRLDQSHPDDPQVAQMVKQYKERMAQLKSESSSE